jgi:CRISPR/Cas system-associated endonuclease Cas1
VCPGETGVTRDQVNRWRREGLLPDVEQAWPEAFHGSGVRYPTGTCTQIKAAKELFETKTGSILGWELWWRGFPVDERHLCRSHVPGMQSAPDIVSLRALVAGSAAAYFRAWREIPIEWKGLNQRPIPESWRRIGSRTSLFNLAGNRNAAHPINAMLNYAYGILESQVRIKSVAEGYDPTIGIMHESREGSSAFIFDIMEPERPKVDRSVLEFMKSHKRWCRSHEGRPRKHARLFEKHLRILRGMTDQRTPRP